MNREEIKIDKGPEYLRTAQELSDIIADLPLTAEQNDRLIAGILAHSSAGRKEAFKQGLMTAIINDNDNTAAQSKPRLS